MANSEETPNVCGLRREDFQTTVNGKKTDLFVLRNSKGNEVAITNYGGAIVALMVPDKDGNMGNVIMGHDNIQDVINSPEPYLSRLIGRFGNRIAKGKFTLHGKQYQVAVNNGPNSLHGGKNGFNVKVWSPEQMNDHALALNYVSPYGEEGYTGELKVTVVYTWTDDNELHIDYLATTNKKTIINLTNHAFISLAGIADPTPSVENVELQVNADFYLPIDDVSIPTGEIRKVEGTPFDFRTAKPIGRDINADDEQVKTVQALTTTSCSTRTRKASSHWQPKHTSPSAAAPSKCIPPSLAYNSTPATSCPASRALTEPLTLSAQLSAWSANTSPTLLTVLTSRR